MGDALFFPTDLSIVHSVVVFLQFNMCDKSNELHFNGCMWDPQTHWTFLFFHAFLHVRTKMENHVGDMFNVNLWKNIVQFARYPVVQSFIIVCKHRMNAKKSTLFNWKCHFLSIHTDRPRPTSRCAQQKCVPFARCGEFFLFSTTVMK